MKLIDPKKQLYSFDVEIEKEVEEETEKVSRKKNKETGKMEKITTVEKKTVKKGVPHQIIIKKPSRIDLEDGDMFYSLQLNKFIKMGLLTKAMIAKQYDDQGGVWSEPERKQYAELLTDVQQKQVEVQRYTILSDEKKISKRQKDKLNKAMNELSNLKRALTEFELMRNSVFDHTADVKSRNKTILWYILHLTYFVEGEEDDPDMEPMFEGRTYEDKYESYQEKEDGGDLLYSESIDRISSIMSIWYVGGGQTQDDFQVALDEIQNTLGLEEEEQEEQGEEAEEGDKKSKEEVKVGNAEEQDQP